MTKSRQTSNGTFNQINWPILIMGIAVQVMIWSSVPLSYAASISTSSIASWGFMFTFQIGNALAILLTVGGQWQNPLALAGIVIALVASLGAAIHSSPLIGLLMILEPIFLLIASHRQFGLQSGYGLSIYALVNCCCTPLAFTKLSTGFLSWQAVFYLTQLFCAYLFFVAPHFVWRSRYARLEYCGIGLLLIITTFFRGISVAHLLAVLIILTGATLMLSRRRVANEFVTYSILQLMCVLLIYW